MIGIIMSIVLFALISIVNAFTSIQSRSNFITRSSKTLLREVPLELTGQLDPKKSWDVKLVFGDQEKIVSISEDTSVLQKAEKVFKGVQSSCRNGVCTTCAGKVD
jgi:ferredoxin